MEQPNLPGFKQGLEKAALKMKTKYDSEEKN